MILVISFLDSIVFILIIFYVCPNTFNIDMPLMLVFDQTSYKNSIPGGPKKHRTVDLLGLCSDLAG